MRSSGGIGQSSLKTTLEIIIRILQGPTGLFCNRVWISDDGLSLQLSVFSIKHSGQTGKCPHMQTANPKPKTNKQNKIQKNARPQPAR